MWRMRHRLPGEFRVSARAVAIWREGAPPKLREARTGWGGEVTEVSSAMGGEQSWPPISGRILTTTTRLSATRLWRAEGRLHSDATRARSHFASHHHGDYAVFPTREVTMGPVHLTS